MLKKIGSIKLDINEITFMVQRLVCEILSKFSPLQILLFGSAASGSMTNASDLDVAIIVANELQVKQCKKSLYGLAGRFGWSIDILVYSRDEFEKRAALGGICTMIADEGKLIWEAKA